ncbi:hypothetical protein L596_011658 [Steinernema carpocapsae]|uniref:Protein kinase domain-containing protein n=1 Tax=Steinernema carpocapsae TaxID=34508 RepID=A0A4U5NVJ2_STECR|nr:hypothetical protein L596_011658 [Steinernema carpocapsae]
MDSPIKKLAKTEKPIEKVQLDLASGTSYKLRKFLGSGAYAKCYRGVNSETSREVALKIAVKEKQRAAEILKFEAAFLRNIEHPNIIKVINFFQNKDRTVMVLELCSESTLKEMLKARRRITEVETRYIASKLVSALRYLHKKTIIHCDVKPQNILLTENLEVKLADFGLAEKLKPSGIKNRKGTPRYMAPELLGNNSWRAFGVDVWALGCVLHLCLVGRAPFQFLEIDVKEGVLEIKEGKFKISEFRWELSSLDRVVSPLAEELIGAMLNPNGIKRLSFSAIQEMAFFKQLVPSALPRECLREEPLFLERMLKGSEKSVEQCYFKKDDLTGLHMLEQLVNNYKLSYALSIHEESRVPLSWVTRFRHSKRNGLCYEMNDGSIQYFFKWDNTTMSELSEKWTKFETTNLIYPF